MINRTEKIAGGLAIGCLGIFVIILTLNFTLGPLAVLSCSRMQCAPIISKCQFLGHCRCDTMLNYTCSKTCLHCLGDLYADCCSCVNICPKQEENGNAQESHVKLFAATNEDLFDLFTGEEDLSGRWQVHTKTLNSSVPFNCTMAYLTSCMDMYKCESSCISMGAHGYRWFHVGCCECVGKYCMNFGVNEIRCRKCPEESDQVIDSASDML